MKNKRILINNQQSTINNFNFGFTFIELIIVVAIVGFLLPVLFSIIFSLLQQQLKVMSLSEIKRQGDYSLTVMSNMLRNEATGIYSSSTFIPANALCNTKESSSGVITDLYFSNANRQYIHFFQDSNSIASESSIIRPAIKLTNNKIRITNFNVQCFKSAQFSAPLVSISFDIAYNVAAGHEEEIAAMKYQTNIKLKNAQ